MAQELKSKKLGEMPVGKLILSMSGPAILSMLVQALYNIVDSIFIGKFDATNGVLALSYAMPIQLLVNAFGVGLAVGTGSMISRLLGQGKNEDASLTAQTGILLALIMSAIFAISGYFISSAFLKAYVDKPEILTMSIEYLTICTCCSFGMMLEIMFNRILQSMGNMIIPMITQIVGAMVNIILDPIFISVAGLGASGAAIATIIGQIVAMCVPVFVLLRDKSKFDIDVFFTKKFRVKKHIIGGILQVGLPTVIMNSIGSIMYMVANKLLSVYKVPITTNKGVENFDVGVWAFGIYFKLNSFAFMPCFGLNQGCIPIMGYNYGANLKKRFDKTFRNAIFMALGYMMFATIIFHAMPDLLLKLFSVPNDETVILEGMKALRLCSVCFIPAAVSVITIAMFNAIGHGTKAMLMSILRQIGILIPLALLLSKFTDLGMVGFWISFPIAEATALAIFFPIALHTIKKIFAKKDLEVPASEMEGILPTPALDAEEDSDEMRDVYASNLGDIDTTIQNEEIA
ncbi:MAG: MATE family efflux transporter [Clostridia bacterium]|nr:MATE family efflux transporter [Clostridia bacterium]